MKKVKKINVCVKAFELGMGNPLEDKLIASGKLKKHEGYYEVFSIEAARVGELAYAGDYVKIDSSNMPYPNTRDRFLSNHIHIVGDDFIQYPQEVLSWTYGDVEDENIKYLLKTKKLMVNPDLADSFYKANLRGTFLTAKKDDLVLIYGVKKAGDKIISVDFNLIDKDEFDKTYEYI